MAGGTTLSRMPNRMPDDEWNGLVRRQRQVHTENSLKITQVGDLLLEAQRARDSEASLVEVLKQARILFPDTFDPPEIVEHSNEQYHLILRIQEVVEQAEARDERG